MPTAMVFETRRFAVHDGPGVRTVLFLKGCPLRCRWCHNPEGIEPHPQLAWYEHKCLHCGACVAACPTGAHRMADGVHVLNRAACVACGACEAVCPARALRRLGHRLTVEAAHRLILEDRDFYRDGGGATLSGGEPLLQSAFCADLFKRLKADGIHCALDTCGAVAWQRFAAVLPWTDMVLYDLKHVDDPLHRAYTGGSNRRILANLRRLATCEIPIEIRIPVIPGFNDDPASVAAIGRALDDLANIVAVRLLPYHHAASKYQALGRAAPLPEATPPSPARMEAIASELAAVTSLVIR